MQAYDSVAIQADLEMGGTDQTFNVLMGRNIQRLWTRSSNYTFHAFNWRNWWSWKNEQERLGNYIGVNEDANTMYEKVMKIPDSMIIKYYNLCTDVHQMMLQKLKRD